MVHAAFLCLGRNCMLEVEVRTRRQVVCLRRIGDSSAHRNEPLAQSFSGTLLRRQRHPRRFASNCRERILVSHYCLTLVGSCDPPSELRSKLPYFRQSCMYRRRHHSCSSQRWCTKHRKALWREGIHNPRVPICSLDDLTVGRFYRYLNFFFGFVCGRLSHMRLNISAQFHVIRTT